MIGPKFAIVLGLAMLTFTFVAALYVVWVRFVGLDPTLAQRFAELSRVSQGALAVGFGVVLGGAIAAMPTLGTGIAVTLMLGSTTFAALLLFELVANGNVTTPT